MARQPEPIQCGHPERPHYSLGLCGPCYWVNYRRTKKVLATAVARRLAELEAKIPA